MKILNKEIDTTLYPHLIINGTSGSGKTTLVKRIIADNINNYNIAYYSPKKEQLREFKKIINVFEKETELLQLLDEIDKGIIKNNIIIIDELIYSLVIYKWLYLRLLKIAVVGRENNNQLILLTQRASYKFFSGELKANVNNIITLRTITKIDSRIAIGSDRGIYLKKGEFIFKQNNMFIRDTFSKRIDFIPFNNKKVLKRIKNYMNYDKERILRGI